MNGRLVTSQSMEKILLLFSERVNTMLFGLGLVVFVYFFVLVFNQMFGGLFLKSFKL